MLVGRRRPSCRHCPEAAARGEAGSESKVRWHACDLTSADGAEARCRSARFGAQPMSMARDCRRSVALRNQIETWCVSSPPTCRADELTRALLPYLRGLPKSQVIFIGSALGRSAYRASPSIARPSSACAALPKRCDGSLAQRHSGAVPRSAQHADDVQRSRRRALQPRHRDRDGQPEVVAQACSGIEDEAAERFLGLPEALAVRINGAMPGLARRRFCQAPGDAAEAASLQAGCLAGAGVDPSNIPSTAFTDRASTMSAFRTPSIDRRRRAFS